DVLPARLGEYDPLWLDGLCLSGEIAWGRLTATRNAEGGTRNRKSGPIRTTPVALFRRERGAVWGSLTPAPDPKELPRSAAGRACSEGVKHGPPCSPRTSSPRRSRGSCCGATGWCFAAS